MARLRTLNRWFVALHRRKDYLTLPPILLTDTPTPLRNGDRLSANCGFSNLLGARSDSYSRPMPEKHDGLEGRHRASWPGHNASTQAERANSRGSQGKANAQDLGVGSSVRSPRCSRRPRPPCGAKTGSEVRPRVASHALSAWVSWSTSSMRFNQAGRHFVSRS